MVMSIDPLIKGAGPGDGGEKERKGKGRRRKGGGAKRGRREKAGQKAGTNTAPPLSSSLTLDRFHYL